MEIAEKLITIAFIKESQSDMQTLSSPFQAARYHSLVIERESCPDCLEIIAETEDGTIMAVQHKDLPHIQVYSAFTTQEIPDIESDSQILILKYKAGAICNFFKTTSIHEAS